jgi:hypothetical protein
LSAAPEPGLCEEDPQPTTNTEQRAATNISRQGV